MRKLGYRECGYLVKVIKFIIVRYMKLGFLILLFLRLLVILIELKLR